jgi:Flp pilus assembly protein protease CpaA
MNQLALFFHAINLIPFTIAAISDIKQRSVSLGWVICVNLIPFIIFLLYFDWKLSNSLLYTGLLFLVISAIGCYKMIGKGDVLISIALFLLALTYNENYRIELIITGLIGIILSCGMWYIFRAIKSIKSSGYPKSIFDLVALFYGRLELEPHLKNYFCNQNSNNEYMLSYIESFRTPDKYRLYLDPCPLIMCLLVGYSSMLLFIITI